MNDRKESTKTFALTLYNLLTPTVYTYDKGFLDEVAAFVGKAGFPEEYDALVRKMLRLAYAKAAGDELGLGAVAEKLQALNRTLENGLSKIENVRKHKEERK